MFAVLRRRISERREDEGFTLIELMVVILIIAILLAIAIPTFLGARTRAQDRAAQSSLRNATTAADTSYTDNQQYPLNGATAPADIVSQLQSVEPALTFQLAAVATGSTSNVISVDVAGTPTGQQFTAAALSKSGKCFWMRTVKQYTGTGTGLGTTPGTAYASSTGTCQASSTTGLTWTSAW